MAAQDIQIAVYEGPKAVHKATSTLSPKFAELGIGAIDLTDAGGGVLSLGGASLGSQALTAGMLLLGNGSNIATPVALSGDITLTNAGVATIAAAAVTTTKLADASVTGVKLAAATAGIGLSQNGTTKALDVNVDGVTLEIPLDTLQVKDAGISTAKLADASVVNAKIGALAVTEDKIAASVAGQGLAKNGTTGKLEPVVDGETIQVISGVIQVPVAGIDTAHIMPGAIITNLLSLGLQNELVDHEGRITTLEGNVAQLQTAVTAIQNNTPQEDVQTSSGVAAYTTAGMTFSASNTVLDIDVYIDGRLQRQDQTGASLQSYKKTSTTAILFTSTIPTGKEIRILKRGTASGPAISGSTSPSDLTSITVDPQPSLNGGHSLGVATKAFSSLFLKDANSSQIYQLVIVNGVAQFTLV